MQVRRRGHNGAPCEGLGQVGQQTGHAPVWQGDPIAPWPGRPSNPPAHGAADRTRAKGMQSPKCSISRSTPFDPESRNASSLTPLHPSLPGEGDGALCHHAQPPGFQLTPQQLRPRGVAVGQAAQLCQLCIALKLGWGNAGAGEGSGPRSTDGPGPAARPSGGHTGCGQHATSWRAYTAIRHCASSDHGPWSADLWGGGHSGAGWGAVPSTFVVRQGTGQHIRGRRCPRGRRRVTSVLCPASGTPSQCPAPSPLGQWGHGQFDMVCRFGYVCHV